MERNIKQKKLNLSKRKILIGLYLLFLLMDVVAMIWLKNKEVVFTIGYVLIRISLMMFLLMELSIKSMKLLFNQLKSRFDFCIDDSKDDLDLYDDIEDDFDIELGIEELMEFRKLFILIIEVTIFTELFFKTATKFRNILRDIYCFNVNIFIFIILMGTVTFLFRYYMNEKYNI